MTIALYYMAVNAKGSSASIVERMKTRISFSLEYINLTEGPHVSDLGNYDHVIFLIATYGDQELQDDFEKFLISIKADLNGKKFSICEIGNYYGYEDFSTGAGNIVESYLIERGAKKYLTTTSIDTLPLIDWRQVDQWIFLLNSMSKS